MTAEPLLAPALLDRPVLEVAPDLLGAVVRHATPDGTVAVRLTEVEAYDGANDPGSHAFRGRTPRNAVMFGPPGHVYVYFTYGMHWCMNLVCGPEGQASAVLLRAGEVVEGAPLATRRRPTAKTPRELARGPARLTLALGVDGSQDGLDATDPTSPLTVSTPAGTRGRRGAARTAGRCRRRRCGAPVAVLAGGRAERLGVPSRGVASPPGPRLGQAEGDRPDPAEKDDPP